jgi:hypothetical protein
MGVGHRVHGVAHAPRHRCRILSRDFFGVVAGWRLWDPSIFRQRHHLGELGKTYVKAGQTVEQGDLIGEVGLTGKTSGPHTHFELTQNNQYIDPMTVLPNLPNIQTAWGDTSENALSLVPQKTTPESKSH